MRWLAIPFVLLVVGPPLSAADLDASLRVINAVGKEGTGNAVATKAWAELVKAGPDALFPILNAIADDKPTSANWLRTAVNAIAENQSGAGGKFDATKLTEFVNDTKKSATSRTITFELLRTQDPVAAKALLPKFLNDSSLDLRRAGIADALPKEPKASEIPMLQTLFAAARDKDQVESIAKELEKLKEPANITKHYGTITQWALSDVFDNTDELGFQKVYAPETSADHKGWKRTQSSATYGTIDLNVAIEKKMHTVAYAAADILADAETPAEIRLASQNAIKVFLNGKEVFGREAYHHGNKMDQHVAKVTLAKGKNTILVKACQNDQPYQWTQVWGFAARICDSTGGALKLRQLVDDKPVSLGELAPDTAKEKK